MEAFGLEVEEDLSRLATQCWAEGIRTGKWYKGQKEAWMIRFKKFRRGGKEEDLQEQWCVRPVIWVLSGLSATQYSKATEALT